MAKKKRARGSFQYDVALSFAGEDREYVRKVAHSLDAVGIRVFYDEHKKVELWGKDLYEHLSEVYQHKAYFCVMFVSRSYARKVWTNHERKNAQARAFVENTEYILPARFDSTKIPGLLPTIGYIDLSKTKPRDLAALIAKKLGPMDRSFYLPLKPDVLFKVLGCRTAKEKDIVRGHAEVFVSEWKRMTKDERLLVLTAFTHGCPTELPKNIHVCVDLLRRETRYPISKIRRLAAGLGSLGFDCSIREKSRRHRNSGKLTHSGPTLAIEFFDRRVDHGGEATHVVDAMFRGIGEFYCLCCSQERLIRGDFSPLSSDFVAGELKRQQVD